MSTGTRLLPTEWMDAYYASRCLLHADAYIKVDACLCRRLWN